MKRITISLPDALASLLADDARRRHRTVSAVVRELLAEKLGGNGSAGKRQVPFAALVSSESPLPASRVDEYLGENWEGEILRTRDSD